MPQPCTPHGDHLARYVHAEQAGAISRSQLSTAIATLIVIAPHAIIPTAESEPGPANTERAICMNHVHVHATTSEPVTRLNRNDPASPFAVIDFGGNWHHTSQDPAWCRRVAAAWTHAAELLEATTEHNGQHDRAVAVAPEACPP